MVPWPSGKARVCKTLIRQFKSGRYLQKRHTPFGVCLFCCPGQDLKTLNATVQWTVATTSSKTGGFIYFFSSLRGEEMQSNLAGTSKVNAHFRCHITNKRWLHDFVALIILNNHFRRWRFWIFSGFSKMASFFYFLYKFFEIISICRISNLEMRYFLFYNKEL